MHLTDCFIDIFAFINDFRNTVAENRPPFDDIKGHVASLLARSQSHHAGMGQFGSDFEEARFAVCAWVDETIVGSGWEHKDLWLKEQLQRTYFNTTDAGVEFFERLNGLGTHQSEVREVYYLCLVLGFTGQYCKPGDERQLGQLKTENLRLLTGGSNSPLDRAELFPEAYPSAENGCCGKALGKRQLPFPLTYAACLLGPLLVFALLFTIYRFSLSTVTADLIKAVAN